MNNYCTILWMICLLYIQHAACFIDPFSATIAVGTVGAILGYRKLKCSFQECCDDHYVNPKIWRLTADLKHQLYGQQLAITPILDAIKGHINSKNSPKALTMAFHGPPGTGKNYVAGIIRDRFFKKGDTSRFYHFFNGRSEFPLDSRVSEYKERLIKTVADALIDCPRSLFVFDEIDDMAEGVLDALTQFLDYGTRSIYVDYTYKSIETRNATFIFLSNTGSQKIVDRLLELYGEGKSRDTMKLADFENLIAMGAFNEKGGFYKSNTIKGSLIDHFIPFLPLEAEHVKSCIKASFNKYGIHDPTVEQIEEVMSFVTFGPSSSNLYALSGCKRLEVKVASIAYRL